MKELICLNEDLIQEWIDGELSEELLVQVNQHLANCEVCRQKAEQQKALAFSIKQLLRGEDRAVNAGPFSRSKKTFPIWLKIVAVLIPAFCLMQVLIQPDNTYQPSHDELLMYQSLSDMDANTAFQERVMVTTSTNQEGEIVEVEIR